VQGELGGNFSMYVSCVVFSWRFFGLFTTVREIVHETGKILVRGKVIIEI